MMQKMYRPTVAEIQIENLRHNARVLRSLTAPGSFFCPMIKSDAYGHGAVEVSRALIQEGVDTLGVALVEEGVHLRQAGVKNVSLLVFYPHLEVDAARALLENNLTPVISSWESFAALHEALGAQSRSTPFAVHVKFNTAMNRVGFAPSEAGRVRDYFHSHRSLELQGVCTHLLAGEDIGSPDSRSEEQLASLQKILADLGDLKPRHVHVFNSGALIAREAYIISSDASWGARPGISLYGPKPVLPSPTADAEKRWEQLDIKPIMRVSSVISQVQRVPKGETISYNGRFRVERDSIIGVVPIGYADGYMRAFSNAGFMLCRGRRVPVVGIVCMDFTMVDLTDLETPAEGWVGEEIVILGAQGEEVIDAETLADIIGTNSYEILTGFSARVPRVYR